MSRRARIGWFTLVVGLYLLHQDLWFWHEARPLVLRFLPIGLAYHAVYCLAVAFLMFGLTRFAWPAHLEDPVRRNRRPEEGSGR